MYINSRFTDLYDWTPSCSYDKSDVIYDRKYSSEELRNGNTLKFHGFVLLIGDVGIEVMIPDKYSRCLSKDTDIDTLLFNNFDYFSSHAFKCIHSSYTTPTSTLEVYENKSIKGIVYPEYDGAINFTPGYLEAIHKYGLINALSTDAIKTLRNTFNVSAPVALIAQDYNTWTVKVFNNISMLASGLNVIVDYEYDVNEVGAYVDQYVSQNSTVEAVQIIDNNVRIVSNGFDKKISFRHRK